MMYNQSKRSLRTMSSLIQFSMYVLIFSQYYIVSIAVEKLSTENIIELRNVNNRNM